MPANSFKESKEEYGFKPAEKQASNVFTKSRDADLKGLGCTNM